MKVGIQLYSVRNSMFKDPLKTIEQVVLQGYKFIEAANHDAEKDYGVGFGVSPEEINEVLDRTGAKIVSAHISPMDKEKIEPVIEYHKKIGTKYIVMPMDFYKNSSEVLKKAVMLNEVGEKCKQAGIQLVYHNHFHEFQVFDGETESIYEMLMNNTDPELVQIEMDTYWVMRGGVAPVEFIKDYGKRIRLIHQKDFPKDKESAIDLIDEVNREKIYVDINYFGSVVKEDEFTEIGSGIMDIQKIIDAANEYADVDYIVLEQDFSKFDELESIRISMENFKKLNGISWS